MTTKEKIIKFLEFKGISKRDFYRQTSFSNGFLDSGKHIGSDNLKIIVDNYPSINLEWLVMDIGEMEKPNVQDLKHIESVTNSVTFSEKTKSVENVTLLKESDSDNLYNRMPKLVTVDNSGKDNIVLVPVKAAAGYLLGYGDSNFVQSLPTFSLPNIQNGTFRMFQVSGDSMYPTLSEGCYVVGEWVENWIKDIKDNRVYVIVCDEGVLVKRVLNRLKKYENLYLKSDNRKMHPTKTLEPSQIKEVWAVKMHLSFDLPDPAVLYDRMSDLEAEIEQVKSLIKAKN